jgi:hypothetical protein
MVNHVRTKLLILTGFFLLFTAGIYAQSAIRESLFTDNYTINPEKEGELGLSIDNISFMHNTESDGDIQKGYTIPGFRLNPHLIYYPASNVKMEAGISLLRYWGADKYPDYSYRIVPKWEANGYQHEFHFLPFFRAQIQPFSRLNIVFGNLYGGSNHELIEPLYNPELNLTADPEMGAQILYNSRILHFDTWVNWESFTFKDEMYNEAVTIGVSTRLNITDPQSPLYFGIPVQGLMIHRGGEIDAVHGELLTVLNATAGASLKYDCDDLILRKIGFDLMGAINESGSSENILPFKKGWAVYSKLEFRLWEVDLKMAFWRSGDFINLYGNPVFGNVSTSIDGRNFPRTMVFNPGVKYEKGFGNGFYLGGHVDYYSNPELISYEEYMPVKTNRSDSWSAGLSLRINPSILLKKVK